jgi:hypothetical protein
LHRCRKASKQRAWHVTNVWRKTKGVKYGYARVSTDDQTTALQRARWLGPDAKAFLRTREYRETRAGSEAPRTNARKTT